MCGDCVARFCVSVSLCTIVCLTAVPMDMRVFGSMDLYVCVSKDLCVFGSMDLRICESRSTILA